MSLGSSLKAHRLKNNLTQVDVAKKLGVTQAMVAEVETGVTPPSRDLQAAISSLLASSYFGSRDGRGPYK